MSPETKANELVQLVRSASIPKEAECLLQGFISELKDMEIGNQDLISFLNELHLKLINEREHETKTLKMINFNVAIDLVEEFKNLI